MKISVCMATRNGGEYIREQLESILVQLESNDELVISDDSSSDDTLDIIRGFNDKRIRIYEGNTFLNPIFNFENAIKNASGDVIVLSDQDDVWLEGRIGLIRKKFEDVKGEIYALVTDGYILKESGEIDSLSIFEKKGSCSGLLRNIYDNCYVGCCMAFSRELLGIALPFPKKIPMHDMWLGLLSEIFGHTDFIDVKTIKYRRHKSNITSLVFSLDVFAQIKRRFFLVFCILGRVARKTLFSGKRI